MFTQLLLKMMIRMHFIFLMMTVVCIVIVGSACGKTNVTIRKLS